MRRGPKNKPIALRVLEGNRSRTPIPVPLEAPSDMPSPPAHLDAYGLEEWNRVADGLNAMGVLCEVDQATLAAYCGAYSRWRHAEEELNTLREKSNLNAMLLKTIAGNWIQQPLVGISNKAAADMVRYAAEFGLTPSARARLAVDPSRGKSSKYDGLLNGKAAKR